MKNDLNKIKKLSANQDLSNRVGVAMFMHARNLDMETASDGDKALIQWILANPMSADQTMLALVATEADVIAGTTVVEEAADPNAPSKKTAANPQTVASDTTAVNIDGIDDTVIEQAVSDNWQTVANKYGGYAIPVEPSYQPAPVAESVAVTQGEPDNPFLETEKIKNYQKPLTRPDGTTI